MVFSECLIVYETKNLANLGYMGACLICPSWNISLEDPRQPRRQVRQKMGRYLILCIL